MTSTEIQNSLIRDILTIQNPQVLKKLKVFLMQIVEEEKVIFSDYEKRVIETGISQVNEGLFFTDEEVIEKTNKWLGE
jgi:predicted transcriptional regulator